ncbi:MAG: calcium-binding protein, partial [Dehalococcoidia bacterium]
MAKMPEDAEREERIRMEIIVDAYGPEEQAMGWYYYLEENLQFPYHARCVVQRVTSPLHVGDEIEIVAMAPEDECEREMFVLMPWEQRRLAVPLSQLDGIDVDEETRQALDDWHYWLRRGY